MALFGFGKDKKEAGGSSESVLAYLEDAQRLRASLTLISPKKMELTATIQSIDENGGLFSLQTMGTLLADKGAKVTFVYLQEGLRLGGTCQVAEVRPGAAVLELPDSLELMERRAQPRGRLNPKEGATLTALTGIFDGVGINGVVENISESGARIKVDKAMNIKGEKKLPLGSGLVPVGQPFMLIKANKLPKCPAVMELEGRAVYLDASQGLAMGLRFDKPRADFASALRSLVGSRTTAVPSSVPPKTRRKTVEAPAHDDSLLPPPRKPGTATEAPKAPGAAVPPAAAPPPASPPPAGAVAQAGGHALPAVPPQAGAHAQAAVPPQAGAHAQPAVPPQAGVYAQPGSAPEAAAGPKNEALLRLKKRSRAVVALAPAGPFGDMLKEFLQEEGYGRVMVTASPEDFLGFLQQPNLSLILLDGDLSSLDALGFVRRLQEAFPHLPPIVMAAEEVSTAIVMAAHRSGVAQMLVKPYALDGTLSDLLAQQMGL